MLYRRFGKTELHMPLLSFGCMRSMHSWQDAPLTTIPNHSNSHLEEIIRSALQQGIYHIETAHGYGSSERQLGEVLPAFNRDDYILQTKVAPSADPKDFLHHFELSLERLGVDRVDLLALHGINDHRSLWYSCREDGCLAAARALQAQGRVGHVGFSGHGPCDVIMAAIGHRARGGFDFVNLHWYYIFDANRQALQLAAQHDMGLFIISPSDKGGLLHTPSATIQQLCRPLSPMVFNDLYCLRQPEVCTISVGASEPDHFDEHLKAVQLVEAEEEQLFSQIDQRLRGAMLSATGAERPESLWYQLPEWHKTPGGINIRFIDWLYNVSRGWGLTEFARQRYQMLTGDSAWVPGNNALLVDQLDWQDLQKDYPALTDQLLESLTMAHNQFTTRSPSGNHN